MKTCRKCNVAKPLDAFGKKRYRPDGLNDWCKACNCESAKRNYRANIEARRESALARYYANRDERIAYVRRWQAENKERWDAYRKSPWYRAQQAKRSRAYRLLNIQTCSARCRSWNRANKERRRFLDERWRRANPEKKRASSHATHAKRLQAEGRYTGTDIKRIFSLQRGRCAYCQKSLRKGYHIDHIKPLAKGGTNWPRNMQLTCSTCNLTKRDRLPEIYARLTGRLI